MFVSVWGGHLPSVCKCGGGGTYRVFVSVWGGALTECL